MRKQWETMRNNGVGAICQQQMSIYSVINTLIHSSRSQNSLKGEWSSARHVLSSCSHSSPKTGEQVSHRAVWQSTHTHTQSAHTHTRSLVASHKYPTRCNFPPHKPQNSPFQSSAVPSDRCPRSCLSASLSTAASLTTHSVLHFVYTHTQ